MKITIIGGGNMGGAIARGLIKGTLVKPEEITISDLNEEILSQLKAVDARLTVTTNNVEAVKEAEIIMVAVKPWLVESVLEQVKFSVDYENQMIVSIAAGVTFDQLTEYLAKEDCYPPILYRVIPNTAISVLESMSIIASSNSNEEQDAVVKSIFDEMGKAIFVEERMMTAGTALASCGTAFALRYVRAAMEGGVELGFYPDVARDIVAQTVKGAVELLLSNGTHPETEIDKVTTPGGITIKGLNEMEHAGFTSAVIRGLKASK